MFGLPAFAQKASVPQPYRLKYDMTVNAHGKATGLKSLDGLSDLVDGKIQQWVYELQFEPASIDGVPRPATTTLYLTLDQVRQPDGEIGYAVGSLWTGPRLIRGTYKDVLHRSWSGYFLFTYDARGHVTEAHHDPEDPSHVSPTFIRWGVALAKSFKIKPETVQGIAVGGQGRLPLIYCAPGWPCPKLEPMPSGKGHDLGGEMVAESVLELKSPVTGDAI